MFFRLFACSLLIFSPFIGHAQTGNEPFLPVTPTPVDGAFPLATDGQAASIYYDAADASVVGIAATALGEDMKLVTGVAPAVGSGVPAGDRAVLIGTLGRSPLIDRLVAAGKLDVSTIRGKWESYVAAVVDQPVPGVGRALVIAGSDRRGTAFGIFGLSEAIGVNPWCWWADVTPAAKPALYVGGGTYIEPSPGVKYRGVFLNDEDWGLQPWAAKTFDPATNDIGPKTYAKIFELLLRLHANFLWPAMHDCTKAFNTFPQNKVVADRYAIVMGSSHHEPMLRDTSEYNAKALGPYNYWTNRRNIYDFWAQRVKENGAYENIYTIGMRGQTDDGMIAPPGTTLQGKVDELQNAIIPDQRQMLTEHVAHDPATVPQMFVPYKEALLQYQAGLRVPDDVTLVWPDDNHGYIRELSTTVEQARKGGSGVYYHLSYWGAPRDFLWLCTTPPAMIWEEMSKAYDYQARNLWIVNIGDIKPGEIGMDFFLRLARHPEAFQNFSQHRFLTEWATRTFGATNAEAIARILDEYYRLNIAVRPEHLNIHRSGFSFTANGDEAQTRLDEFAAMVKAANALAETLPANLQDAYYELVLYPVRCSALMNQKVLDAERSRLYATQGRAATAKLAASSQAAYDAIQKETDYYNTKLTGGKWARMMSDHPHPTSGDVFTLPALGSYDAPEAAGLGVAVDGSSGALSPAAPGRLPTYNPAASQRYFVDIFNTGKGAFSWSAQASAPWITLSENRGTADSRLLVGIDWTQAPRGDAVPGTVTVTGAGATRTINVAAFNPPSLDVAKLPADVENNGTLSIEAEDFRTSLGATGAGWRRIEKAAPSRDAVTIFPTTAASVDPANIKTAPWLEYEFYTFSAGPLTIHTACLPTHKPNQEHPGVRYAISLNGETPQIVNVDADEYTPAWDVNVLRARAIGTSRHTVATPGLQTLRVYMVDAGVVLDRFDLGVGYRPGGEFEAESLPVAASSGKKYRVFADAPSSAGSAAAYESSSNGDYFTVALPDLRAGNYNVSVRTKELNNRGVVHLSVADSSDGTYTDFGKDLDMYSANPAYVEFTGNRLVVSTSGTKYLRFQVTGRNPANTSGLSWIVVDRIDLTPEKQW